MKKVLFVATVVQKHINVFHLPFLKMFQDEGYRTYVAASNDTGLNNVKIPYCDEYVEIDFRRNPLHPGNLKAFRKMIKLISNNDFDIIHCHTPVGGLIGRLAAIGARKKGTRVFYTAHGFHFYKGAPLQNWLFYYPVEKICSYFTDVLITINKEDYDLAQRKMKAKQTQYVPGVGIDISKFNDIKVNYTLKRRELKIPEDVILLTSVGEISTRKNHQIVLQALARIDDENIHYAIVGDGPLRVKLELFAKKHNISHRVHFLGYRSDVAEIYRVTDICCFPSIQEGLPVALMEAMACGLPCIVSEIRGNIDLQSSTNGALLCKYNKSSEFAYYISALACDSKKRHKMGEENLNIIQDYDTNVIVEKFRAIYDLTNLNGD